jgi:hypothetical protein
MGNMIRQMHPDGNKRLCSGWALNAGKITGTKIFCKN